jgi:hypothetical protein
MRTSYLTVLLAFITGFSLSGLINSTFLSQERAKWEAECDEVTRLHRQAEHDLNELRASIAAGMSPASLMPEITTPSPLR